MKTINVNLGDYFKTSAEWQALKPKVQVLDPDGWDRLNYEYSWNDELITEKEYMHRRSFSTCMFKVPPISLAKGD